MIKTYISPGSALRAIPVSVGDCCLFQYNGLERFVKIKKVDDFGVGGLFGWDFVAKGWRNFHCDKISNFRLSSAQVSMAINFPS